MKYLHHTTIMDLPTQLRAKLSTLQQAQQHVTKLMQDSSMLLYQISQQQLHTQHVAANPVNLGPRQKQTCHSWAKDIAHNPSCAYAHHYFPTIVWRSHHNGQQTMPCGYWDPTNRRQGPCEFHESICGFAHARGDDAAVKERRIMLDHVAILPYRALCTIQCKGCLGSFATVDEVIQHCGPAQVCPMAVMAQGMPGGAQTQASGHQVYGWGGR